MVQAGSVVKLFVGQIPKTLEEDGVREVFQEYGEIAEIVILRDRRSGMHQGCCFVKYNGLQAAQAAISALHNQRSLPPLRNPLQVRFADSGSNGGERGQTNAENKLFVGGVPSGCGEKELRQLFGTYGEVQDVYILASKYGSQEGQRGCAFVRYASPQSCVVAINALHGKYAMKAGELPLVVRYADPPKSRSVGPNGMYGGANGGGNGRFGGWNNGAPPLWPPSGAPAPPPGWPLPWNMGGPGGPNAYGPSWPMSNGYNYPPQQPSPPPPQQQPPPPPQYQQAPPPRKHSPPVAGYGGVSPPTTADMPPPPPPAAAPVPASNWSEHRTADGLKYFYNTATGTSSWERPPELASTPSPSVATPPVSVPPLMGGGDVGGTTAAAAALANSMASLSLAAPTASLPMGGNGMGNSMHNSMSMAMGGLASDSYSGYSNGSFTGSGKAGPDTATTLPGLGAFASNNNGAPNGHSGVVKQGSAVLVSDLPPHFSPSDLQTAFSRFGTITFCELETGSSSGRVGFDSPLSALHAASTMNGAALGDSTLQVVGLPYLPASA